MLGKSTLFCMLKQKAKELLIRLNELTQFSINELILLISTELLMVD